MTWDEDADRDVSGVTWHSKERAAPGLNLFTNDVDRVLLMDSEGLVLRQWELPGRRQCEHVELIKGLRLAVVCEGEALIVLEPGGEVVLEFARAGPSRHRSARGWAHAGSHSRAAHVLPRPPRGV